ncbi:ciliogenesis-associated TTC17-interacting protein isoform X2 [Tachypleus tridentatus]|uniref:ciliogenesis-associated TTC17-interacting protein isoform X2 n=1 Tax=Tachypleus tridentatus TaxID=6853 RepID=UPI003FD6BBD7
MEFLSSVDIQDIKQLLFTDSLVSFSDEDHAVGELSITTDIVSRIGQPCILVNANSHGIVGSVPCGTSVTAHLKPNLETLEQIYHEYVELENHSFDKKTVITRRNAKYIVKCTTIKGSDIQKKEHIMSEEDMQGFISEGANILLQRLLVRKGLQEPTSFKSLDSECKLCIVMYIPLSKEERIFAGKEVQVVGIERRILSQDGSTSIWQAFFTTEGCLVQLNQEGSPVKMKLIHRTCAEKKLKTKCNWKEDLQFCSLYLDKKQSHLELSAVSTEGNCISDFSVVNPTSDYNGCNTYYSDQNLLRISLTNRIIFKS